jgi:putative redox protein
MSLMKVNYIGNLKTEATHLDSKATLLTAAPKDNQGDGSAFSPTDMLCTSLASCKLTIMAIKAKALGISIDGVTVDVEKRMSAQPTRRVAEVVLNFHWNGVDTKITNEQMESLKRSAQLCPVALSLDPNVKQTTIW